MNIKNKLFSQIASLLFIAMIPISASAQQKSFTLEDLNYGGTNYRNMVAQNRWCTWWGDELVRQDVDACYLVNKKNGKARRFYLKQGFEEQEDRGEKLLMVKHI